MCILIIKPILVSLIITAIIATAPAQDNPKSKSENIIRILDVVKTLSQLATHPATIKARTNAKSYGEFLKLIEPIQRQIREQVETIGDTDDLVTLGLICRKVLYPQKAEEVSYERILDWAYWHCVRMLARDASLKGTQSLERLSKRSYLQEDEYREFQEIISEEQSIDLMKKNS